MKAILTAGLFCFIFMPSTVMAQDFLPFIPKEPEQAPVDGGLGILAAAGGAYAIKKLKDKE